MGLSFWDGSSNQTKGLAADAFSECSKNRNSNMACPDKWNPYDIQTCGPYPGGFILTHTHMSVLFLGSPLLAVKAKGHQPC